MAELALLRVKKEISSMLEELDRSCLRSLQGDMHRCAAKCCDNKSLSTEEVPICVDNCSRTLTEVQSFLQGELTNYQDRVQRCVMTCQDNIKDKMTPSTTEAQVGALTKDFEACVAKCADAHIALIPPMLERMKAVLMAKSPLNKY